MSVVDPRSAPAVPIDLRALADAAARLRRQAGTVASTAAAIAPTWGALPEVYAAPESAEVTWQMSMTAEGAELGGEAITRIAVAMEHLADDLVVLDQRSRALADGGAAGGRYDADRDREESDVDAVCRGAALRAEIDTALERARADVVAIGGPPWWTERFAAVDAPVGPRMSWAAHTEELIAETSFVWLAALARAGTEGARRLLAAHPDWGEHIRRSPPAPRAVRTWWDGLDERSAQSLVAGAPAVVGALGGVPARDRVAANRVIARQRRGEVDAEIERWRSVVAEAASAELRAQRRRALDAVVAERDYLRRVERGAVQLYLYDRERGRLVEMVGTPDAATSTVFTYVPGTFTTAESFYRNEVQRVANWMVENNDDMVGFVWKGTDFPGDDEGPGASERLKGLIEANAQERAAPAGRDLASFQEELAADHHLRAARRVALGHSWGLVPISAAEAAGTRYDQVHSLAGAWVSKDWAPAAGTRYHHWTYVDFLSMFQDAGVVGDGRNPDVLPAFESRVFEREGDVELRLGGGLSALVDAPGWSFSATTSPLDNHNLIAGSHDENRVALNAVKERMRR